MNGGVITVPIALTRRLENNLWKMAAMRLLFWTHFFSSVLIPFYRDWGGLSFSAIFLLNAWFMAWNFLLEIPTGTVADVFGRKISLALGAFTAAGGVLTLASTPSVAVFLAGEWLMAASFTLMSGADEALVYDTLRQMGEVETAKRAYGRLESFKLAGIVIGALSGGVIANRLGLTAPVLLTAVPLALCGALALTLVEPAHGEVHERLPFAATLLAGVRYFRAHQTLRALALDMVTNGALSFVLIWLYQPLLERAGLGLPVFGVVHAAIALSQIAILSNVTRLEALVGGSRPYLFLAALLPGAAYLLLAPCTQPGFVVALVVLGASFGLSRPPLFLAQMNRHIPSRQRATVLSTISMLRTAAVALLNPLVGMAADRSIGFALAALGVAMIAVAVTSRASERHLDPATP